MAHAKLALFDELNGSLVPDDPHLGRELIRYFPRKLSEAFPEEVRPTGCGARSSRPSSPTA